MKLVALLLFPLSLQALAVTATSAVPTQAALAYTAPSGAACTVEVSESNTYSPLVHDVDPTLFSGSNLDSRPGTETAGTSRIFLVGTRDVEVALDTNSYSRALQQGTLHYYRVTCAGPVVATGTFTTKTLPFGVTYQDLMPMKSDGNYNPPTIPDTRNYHVVDSQTGVLLNKITVHGDSDPPDFKPSWTSSGGFGQYCADDLSPQGNWRCVLPGFSSDGDYMYSIDPTTGTSNFLGLAGGQRSQLDPAAGGFFGTATGFAEMENFKNGDANVMYAAVNLFGRNTAARWTYTGNDVPVAPSIPPNRTSGVSVDMLGGNDLTDLLRAFDSGVGTYDLVGTVTTTASGSCPAFPVSVPYTVAWASGSNFIAGNTLVGAVINIGTSIYKVCSVPTTTSMVVADYYGNPLSGPNPSPVAYRWKLFSCQLFGAQSNHGMIKCPTGNQDSMTWEGTVDFGNGIPMGTGGSTVHVDSATAPFASTTTIRWSSDHSYEFMGEAVPIFTWAMSKIDAPAPGGGPYQVVLGSSLPSVTKAAPGTVIINTNITINSASLIGGHNAPICDDTWSTPAGWVDGEPLGACYPHYLQDLNVGDVFVTIVGGTVTEHIQIVAKHSHTSYDLQRGTQESFTVLPAHSPGELFWLFGNSGQEQYNATQGVGWGYAFWAFLDSPHGDDHPGDFVLNWGTHPVTRGNVRTEYLFDNNAAPTNKAQWGIPPPYSLPTDSTFGGVLAPASGNFFQKHPSMASGSFYSQFDVWYLVGGGASSISPVTCTPTPCTHVWQTQAVGPPIAPKVAPIFGKTYGRNIVDISAPGKVLSDADDFVFCIARVAGECAQGSSVGGVYFSDSNLDPVHGGQCTGGENPSGLHDICIANWDALGQGAVQSKFFTNDLTGAKSMRALSRAFSTWEMNASSSGNLKLTYAGDWALWWRFPTYPTYSPFVSEVYAIKVPVDPGDDGIDRGQYVPATLNLTPPPGIGIAKAQVKFWYNEQSGTISNPFCTSRREGCVAVKPAINLTAQNTCVSVTNVCTVTVTSLGIPGSTFDLTENPTSCAVTGTNTPVGFTVFATGGTNPINTVTFAYPAQPNVMCTVWGAPFSYLTTDTVTPAACSSSCTIQLPIAPLHTAYFSVEYLDSGNTLVTSRQGLAMENTIINLGVQTGSAYQGTLSGTFR